MVSITTINWTDTISSSRTTINNNFTNLNNWLILQQNLPQWWMYNWRINTSVDWSGNLTISLLTTAWSVPSTSSPIYVRIGNTVRTITSSLSLTNTAWINYLNCWSSELATKEVDFFVYLWWLSATSTVWIWISRIPYARVWWDFVASFTNEKWSISWFDTNDEVEVVWRFNWILSAWAWYTWSAPSTSIIINKPIYETRWLTWTPTQTAWGSMTYTSITNAISLYKLSYNETKIIIHSTWTIWWTPDNYLSFSRPIAPANTASYWPANWCMVYDNSATVSWFIFNNSTVFSVRRYDSANWTAWTAYYSWEIFYSI